MPAGSKSFVILESVDSTNNYAMGMVHSGKAEDGNAWFAMEQTNGKGRRGTEWKTEKAQNVILTIVSRTQFLKVYEQFQISVAASLGCCDFFKVYHNINLKIKWPNDLFWNDKKAGGILIENIIKGNIWEWAVIGIGININQTEFSLLKNQAVSLKQITGQTYNVIKSGKELYLAVEKRLEEIKANGFKKMLAEYNRALYRLNERVRLKKKNIIFETTITGVSEFGQLQTLDTLERKFDFDEVEWML
jgi:BirA family biotin operon repressor/biotin-[acetyl-CoA-carboxylase] ligase